MITNLEGRIDNVGLSETDVFCPIFEAVVNSIHACEDVVGHEDACGNIYINIERGTSPFIGKLDIPQQSGHSNTKLEKITGFTIIDDGIGFTDSNLISFKTLDTSHRKQKGGRGVGRLMWLKVFNSVAIRSVFCEDDKKFLRTFSFTKKEGIVPDAPPATEVEVSSKRETIVSLTDFVPHYNNYAQQDAETISRYILEHCLWYFICNGGAPNITVTDGDSVITLKDLYLSYVIGDIERESINISGHDFNLTFARMRTMGKKHSISFCAADRIITTKDITGKIPGLFSNISDNVGPFTYLCFISGKYLDDSVRPERTDFHFTNPVIPKGPAQSINYEIITNRILERVSKKLEHELQDSKQAGRKRLEEFVEKISPKYKPIIARNHELTIDPNSTDKNIDRYLYEERTKMEDDITYKTNQLSSELTNKSYEEYHEHFKEYLTMVSASNKADLINYVVHRKAIIKFLGIAIGMTTVGKYQNEKIIHDLIMPMHTDSSQLKQGDANLWLIDERLAFHNYLASDINLKSMPVTGSDSKTSPDVACLQIYEDPILVNPGDQPPLASITVVEIKKPMRDDYTSSNNPIDQVLKYVKKIREGKIRTAQGRPIPNSESVPAFCYILADLTPSLKALAEGQDFIDTSDKMGCFLFHKRHNAYIEILGYDKLLASAKERNMAFFDKLGLPCD